MSNLKVCAISDLHGQLNFEIEPSDILLICGDISPVIIQTDLKMMSSWIDSVFIPWCNNLPIQKIFLIAGNHDFYLEENKEQFLKQIEDTNIVYLQDESYTYALDNKEYIIYGTPWCHQFGYWAFMTNDEQLTQIYSQILNNVDILLTHDCPYGFNDVCYNNGIHIGNKPLAEIIKEKQPKYVFTGHLHSTEKSPIMLNNSRIQNVCLLDESYILFYEPTYLTIEK